MYQRGFFGVGFYGFGLLFWVLVAFFVVLVWLGSRGKDRENEEEHLNILKRRYARGEITREEYNRMREELE
ncbi:MAG: SHOCT domain-containing protein [Theionarchaea archaeon]|nr:SHOCT domain-containing protein [Theionarchaea archaeon]MBU6999469.1 SHOCT domain-containing protein [Theionarchaea archaeon]MBU7022358.1 SHOCT domain-containing protein [Theionarchaea archaeon]